MQNPFTIDPQLKQEIEDQFFPKQPTTTTAPIQLSDTDDDGDDVSGDFRALSKRRRKLNNNARHPTAAPRRSSVARSASRQSSKQFWKSGDYDSEGFCSANLESNTGGMDHFRVHPKFLHSNATSHKWALGAFAELLDNALDEVSHGATYVNIDMLINKKDKNKMLLIEDNGGGMDPDKLRQCMSLGYSAKSKLANTIGQYGNGFKTSTMRLGADVIVFSRSCGRDGKSITQSIGLLSYTFLRSTGKEDIVVPILDYELKDREWHKIMRSSSDDWSRIVDTMITWSPYGSENELLQQFNLMIDHGTRIIIYNLWEDDQGQLELDFTSDRYDIQIRGVNRDEKNIQMAKEFPNSRHFLTYKHSLRSYASILYLRHPPNFRMIIRGKDVEHHNIVNDMMMSEEVTYLPQPSADGVPRLADMVAIVTIGFVKDAIAHIDVQGFNVYHKNRLIKPFWRVWNASGSDGRGVIGVLEANFVEPAHDKQGFERTTVLARLETKLVQMQKNYWGNYCHKIGYAPRRNKNQLEAGDRESSPEYTPTSSRAKHKGKGKDYDMSYSPSIDKHGGETMRTQVSGNDKHGNDHSKKVQESSHDVGVPESVDDFRVRKRSVRVRESSKEPSSPSREAKLDGNDEYVMPKKGVNGTSNSLLKTHEKDHQEKAHPCKKTSDSIKSIQQGKSSNGSIGSVNILSPNCMRALDQLREENHDLKGRLKALYKLKEEIFVLKGKMQVLDELKKENLTLKERLKEKTDKKMDALERDLQLERDKCRLLETELNEAKSKIEELNKEQECLIDIFSEERDRRDLEEETLRKRLREASNSIEE